MLRFATLNAIPTIVAVTLHSCLAPAHIPARSSRLAFWKAMKEIRVDYSTEAKVKRLLGPPDDIWPPNDSSKYVTYGDAAWCYGTNGHHTFPTLGLVMFRGGKVLYKIGAEDSPPPEEVIGEEELKQALRQLSQDESGRNFPDSYIPGPERLLASANMLIAKGQTKALAILKEYDRISVVNDAWLFWLVRVAFISKAPGGVFPIPQIGWIDPPPPSVLADWPTYPIYMVDDIPVNFLRSTTSGGVPEPFGRYLEMNESNWSLRSETLRPPNDPFLAYSDVLSSAKWPFAKQGYEADYVLGEILWLVRSSYHSTHFPMGNDAESIHMVDNRNFEKYHEEYLALGCHWDANRCPVCAKRWHIPCR